MQRKILLVLALFISYPLLARNVSGTVTGGGAPVAGAIVTVTSADGLRTESVYSNESGRFSIETNLPGALAVRARHPSFADYTSPQASAGMQISLRSFASDAEITASLPASSIGSSLAFPDAETKHLFVSQCQYCHQIGNALTRQKKTPEVWKGTIARMEGMGSLITFRGARVFPEVLGARFDGSPMPKRLSVHPDPSIFAAKIREWTLGDPISFIHDLDISETGKIYGADMSLDRMYEVNADTGAIRKWDLPPIDLPPGGMFSGAYHPLGTFGAKHGPHSVISDGRGKLWTTNSLSAAIMSFSPATGQYEVFPLPEGIYPHTLRMDAKGRIWFSIAISNQLGMFDPAQKSFRIIDLPSNGFLRWIAAKLTPAVLKIASWFPEKNLHVALSPHKLTGSGFEILSLPYGIDVNPRDGSIWYSKLYAGKIGRVDPETLAVEELDLDLPGPRRMRFSRDGFLWIPAFTDSALLRFDPVKREIKRFPLPVLAPDEYETPYALAVHPQTQEIWITGGFSDRLIRFNPAKETFTAYPLPTRVTFMREIVFRGRDVCSSYSNLPAYAIEGNHPKIVCLEY